MILKRQQNLEYVILEILIGARPGEKLVVNFRANSLEEMVHRTGRRLALGLTAAASVLAMDTVHIRSRRWSADRWPGCIHDA